MILLKYSNTLNCKIKREGKTMLKKFLLAFLVVAMIFVLTGCEEEVKEDLEIPNDQTTTESGTKSSGSGELAGVYVYEKYEGDLPFIITSYVITLNSDNTYNLKHVWDSKESNQTVTGDNNGTWAVVDGQLVLTNDSKVDTIFEIDQDRIIETMHFGFGENAYPVEIFFKKE
jgi:uncharacterized lipoprotein NlpE involved in copper resistance